MRLIVPVALVSLLSGANLLAQTAIEGSLANGTSGGPGRAERVMLLRLAGGMSQVAALTNVTGSFRFELAEPGPYLVQALYSGATYTARVPPQEGIATVALTLFEATTDDASLRVRVPHLVLIVDGPKLHVSHVFEIENATQPPQTIVGEPGAFRFSLPEGATITEASVATSSMPLRQEPVDTTDDRGQTIAYPLKPGVTQYSLQYEIPYGGEIELKETLFHGAEVIHVIVVPAELGAEIPGLEVLGREERQGVSFLRFQGANLPPGTELAIRIRGNAIAPSAPSAAGSPASGAGDAGASGEGEIKDVPTDSGRGATPWLLLGIATLVLTLAIWVGIGREPVAKSRSEGPRASERVTALFSAIAALDRELAGGAVAATDHELRRAELKREVLRELVSGRRKKKSA